MSPEPSQINVRLPGARKAAMFLMGIGDKISADVIRQLAPDEISRISREISALDSVPPDQMLRLFREFEDLSATSQFFAKGGADCARRLIEQAMGAETAQKLLDNAPPPAARTDPGRGSSPFQNTDPRELAKVLREENPQTLAIVLSNLAPEQAGPLMATLPAEVQPQVALRIALMDRIAPAVFNRIAEAIQSRLRASRQLTKSNGSRALASILNHVEGELAERVLTAMEPDNQGAVESVRQLMFVFEDIVNIDQQGIKALLAKVDRKVLTVALKGTSEKVRKHFTESMSQRSAEMLAEDMEALGPVRIRDVSAAQAQIVTAIRELEKEGAIVTSRGGGGGGGDEYVV